MDAFIKDAPTDVLRMGQQYFWVTVPFYPALILLFIYRYTLQGLGHSLVPTIAGFIELGMRIFTAFFIAPALGYTGVLICHPLAWGGVPLRCLLWHICESRQKKPRLIQRLETENTHMPSNPNTRVPDDIWVFLIVRLELT